MEKRTQMKKHCKERYVEWFLDARALKTLQKQVSFGPTLCRKTCKNKVFLTEKKCNNIELCLSWPAALAHGKIEENSGNSDVFNGFGRSGN